MMMIAEGGDGSGLEVGTGGGSSFQEVVDPASCSSPPNTTTKSTEVSSAASTTSTVATSTRVVSNNSSWDVSPVPQETTTTIPAASYSTTVTTAAHPSTTAAPEVGKQPLLETISKPVIRPPPPPPLNAAVFRGGGGSPPTGSTSPRMMIHNTQSFSDLPRNLPSSMMTGGEAVHGSRRSSASTRRHQRTRSSDDIPRTIQGYYPGPPPPPPSHYQHQLPQPQSQQIMPPYPYNVPIYGAAYPPAGYSGYNGAYNLPPQQPTMHPNMSLSTYQASTSTGQRRHRTYSVDGGFGLVPDAALAASSCENYHVVGGMAGGTGAGTSTATSPPTQRMTINTNNAGAGGGSQTETLPLLPRQNSERILKSTSNSRRRRHHRKSYSFNAAIPSQAAGYGSFWSAEEGISTEQQQQQQAGGGGGLSQPPSFMMPRTSPSYATSPSTGHATRKQFDPRGEIMSLTSGLRSPKTGTTSSPSAPTSRKVYNLGLPGSSNIGERGGAMLGRSSNHSSVNALSLSSRGGGLNGFLSSSNYVVGNSIGSHNNNSNSINSRSRVAWSPVINFNDPSLAGGTVGAGGEAMFLSQKRYKSESVRRKHMRQHSSQLYMEVLKGVEQPPRCRDVAFLLLFVFHLLFIVYLGNIYSSEAFRVHTVEEQEVVSTVTVYYTPLLRLACISGVFGVAVSTVLLGVMSIFPKHFVQVALVVVITLSFVWGTIGIGLSPKNIVPVTGIIALALSVAYAFIVWDRIPFAAANLASALSGIRSHPSTVALAVFVQLLTVGWSIYFWIVVIGVYDSIRLGKLQVSHQVAVLIYVMLGISFYWTFQVLLNTVQTVTAGVIGKWWHSPDAQDVVRNAASRTIFYSMGSICFGSLFVGPVRLIRQVAVLFRPSSADEATLLCLHECLLCIQTCITTLVDALVYRFNSLAFTYIGLYGYSFTEAGRRATDIFHKRGWTMIVSDDLVPNVLLMTSLVLGGVTGCFTQLMEQLQSLRIVSLNEPETIAFVVGLVNGLVLTSVLFSVISSSVNTVLVCFAISPVDFDRHHPELSDDMRNAWREVWPGALDVVDLRIALASPAHSSSKNVSDGLASLFVPPSIPVDV